MFLRRSAFRPSIATGMIESIGVLSKSPVPKEVEPPTMQKPPPYFSTNSSVQRIWSSLKAP